MLFSRRKLITETAAMLGAKMISTPMAFANDAPDQWLDETPYINFGHRLVSETALGIAQDKFDPVDKAQAIFRFVRDEIAFGFARGFWDNSASAVLKSRVGYCNTKSTLFVALLRASGIPARQVFVDIHASVLDGIIAPGTPYVDHSYVEVWLNGAWVATDAYIVDRALFEPAQAKTKSERRLMGYGVHQTGLNNWDGRDPSFSQYNQLDPRPISTSHWGVYKDVGDFYRNAESPWNRLNPFLRAGFGTFSAGANRRAEKLRQR